jgi:hypothetical protein
VNPRSGSELVYQGGAGVTITNCCSEEDSNLGTARSDFGSIAKWSNCKDVVVVTHQSVIARLAPNANRPITQWQSFDLVRNADGQLSSQKDEINASGVRILLPFHIS